MSAPVVHDAIAVGAGPFNLGFAALAGPAGLDVVVLEGRDAPQWHPGMMLAGTHLQVPFLADLVSLADPTHPLSFLAFNPSRQYPGHLKSAALGLLLWWAPLAVLTGLTIGWHLILAMVMGLHVTLILNWTKKAQEHGAGLATEPDYTLRSRTYLYAAAPVTSPFHINYHFEHHANFNVPWYDLPAYHEKLKAIVPEALQPYYFHRDFFQQLAGTKPLPPRELLLDPEPTAVASR